MFKLSYIVLIICFNLSAKVEILKLSKTIFKNNKNCKQNNTCDLKKVIFEFSDYKVSGQKIGVNFGSRLFSSYETKKVSQLSKYVFVQYIQGCVFNSTKKDKTLRHVRRFYGNIIDFKHPEMVIDSIDTDPVYNSAKDRELPRHFFYRWNTKKDSYNINTEVLYGNQTPRRARLYIVDHPGGLANARYDQHQNIDARNLSFKLKTCLYKNKDVPNYLPPESSKLKNAITCYDWSSSFIFNHQTKKFESRDEIDSICLN